MTLPPLIVGAALAFWGWETGNLAIGIALALLAEGFRRYEARFDLEPQRYERLSDLCTVAFVALVGVMAANRGLPHGILAGFQFVPATLMPILVAQYASTPRRIRLSALFRYLRKQKQRDAATEDPWIDLGPAFLATTLLAAGVANQRGPNYYVAILAFAAWALWARRPAHARLWAWGGLFALAGTLGYAGHVGLNRLQEALEDFVSEWQLRQSTDPSRASTDMGAVGRLKQQDAILARVYAPRGDGAGFRLLHRSSFNVFAANTWQVRNAPLAPLQPEADGSTWTLAAGEATRSLQVVAKTDAGRAMLPLPAGTRRVADLPTPSLRTNEFGATLVEVPAPWVRYDVRYADGMAGYGSPANDDVALPGSERATIERVAASLGLAGLPPAAAVARVQAHLAGFRYSTFREGAIPRDRTALADFLEHSRAGHCEYFAAAAALLLRAAGVPTRYATGFAVLEYSDLEGAWLVRARHAHAWTRAWVDGRWVDLDPTPPSWFEEEARQAPFWQPLADLLRWGTYRWSQRSGGGMSDGWYAVVAILFVILAWRIVKGRRNAAGAAGADAATRRAQAWPGADSEFYALERAIAERYGAREPGESFSAWLARVRPPEDLDAAARRALALHYRYRFDPAGMSATERAALRGVAVDALQHATAVTAPAIQH